MEIYDITDVYITSVLNNNDYQTYEQKYPELFEHYYRFWSKRKRNVRYDEEEVRRSTKIVLSFLDNCEQVLYNNKLSLDDIPIVLFVGVGNTNGHAFKDSNKFVVWIPVETYTDELYTCIFLTHEIVHAIHYKNSPGFYFASKNEQIEIARQLITEGTATYVTREVHGLSSERALWGTYISEKNQKKWMDSCADEYERLKETTKKNYYSCSHSLEYFYANDESDIYKFRSGYYVGLRLIEQFVEKNGMSLDELLRVPVRQLKDEINNLL